MTTDASHDIPVADRVEGLLQPFAHGEMIGQNDAEARFIDAANTGRLHHAWLLSGPRGVGKATFAFRIARHFVERQSGETTLSSQDFTTAANPDNRAFRQVAAGAHPNILHMRIPWDDQTKKFKTQLTVDEIRKTVHFFSSTAGEDGWRVAIVDSADDLNLNAANALLKILEEPPARTLFFLLSESPRRLLPTIRSRCRTLDFAPLSQETIANILPKVATEPINPEDFTLYFDLIRGSVRRAYLFAVEGNAEMKQTFDQLIAQTNYDMELLHRFADAVSARGGDDRFAFFIDFLEEHISSHLRAGNPSHQLVRWAEVWEKVRERLETGERLNLDRKQTVLALFHDFKALTTA